MSLEQSRRVIAKAHDDALRNFARRCAIEPDSIAILAGSPDVLLPIITEKHSASVIVIAARNLSRWEGARDTVTAELVLADSRCDEIFIKQTQNVTLTSAQHPPASGTCEVESEQAMVDQRGNYQSPAAVVEAYSLSSPLSRRILRTWQQNEEAKIVVSDEGGPLSQVNTEAFDQIVDTLDHLEKRR